MKIGLFFGSFNPIHNGHLIIAEHVLNFTDLKEVWFVVSPQNPFKNSNSLLNENHRINLVRTAIEGENRFKASNVEFKLPRPSYTVNTLAYLKEKYPQHEFGIIMGSDGFQNLPQWKNAEIIINQYPIYIYKRPGYDIDQSGPAQIHILEAPLLQISSTHIRYLISERKSIRFLVPDAGLDEIERNAYYQNSLENPSKNKTT